MEFRPFLNTDPPSLVRIWRSQQRHRYCAAGMSQAMLEEHIFSKPYFDREGLILAFEGTQPLGFVHAGFGPTENLHSINHRCGIVSLLMIDENRATSNEVETQLLNRAHEYLRARGADTAFVGSRFPYGPFYMGIYGGSQVPGIFEANARAVSALRADGYVEKGFVAIMQLPLTEYRTGPDLRKITLLRRQFRVQEEYGAIPSTWWDACTLGTSDLMQCTLVDRRAERNVGQLSFWDIHPLSREWGVPARGMLNVSIQPDVRGQGLASLLIADTLRMMQQQGIGMVEAQIKSSNRHGMQLLEKFGFRIVDQALMLTRSL